VAGFGRGSGRFRPVPRLRRVGPVVELSRIKRDMLERKQRKAARRGSPASVTRRLTIFAVAAAMVLVVAVVFGVGR
jgi:hypothetical protein